MFARRCVLKFNVSIKGTQYIVFFLHVTTIYSCYTHIVNNLVLAILKPRASCRCKFSKENFGLVVATKCILLIYKYIAIFGLKLTM